MAEPGNVFVGEMQKEYCRAGTSMITEDIVVGLGIIRKHKSTMTPSFLL
jgi:hypothetical protein